MKLIQPVRKLFCLLTGCLILFSTGCAEEPQAGPSSQASANSERLRAVLEQSIPTEPNPPLRTIDLYLGRSTLKTELALREKERQTGMMYRESMGENEAMLFVFSQPSQVGFWMKNVSIPLSCAYISPEGIIKEIHDMTPFEEATIDSQSNRIQYVLEVNQGWFERNGIRPGTEIRTDAGSLRETFFNNAQPTVP